MRLGALVRGGVVLGCSLAAVGAAHAASDDVLAQNIVRAPQLLPQPLAQTTTVAASPTRVSVGVEVNLDGTDDGAGGKFLYLKGDFGAAPMASDKTALTLLDAGNVATGAQAAGLIGSFTPSHANMRLGFASTVGGATNARPGFDVALTSSLAANGGAVFNPLSVDFSTGAASDRTVNFGLSLGYAGFNLGAAYLEGDQGFDYGYRGYDVGLGYQRGNWGTVLGFSGIEPTSSSMGMNLLGAQSQYTMRLGAFYQIMPGLTLGGRFQFHDSQHFDAQENQNSGEFFLNTNLNF